MGPANLCPYVGCTNAVAYSAGSYSCACELRLPLSACLKCGMENRTGAAFCRRCHADLVGGVIQVHDLDGNLESAKSRFTTIPGDFRRGPIFLHGSMYAIATDGSLYGVSLRDGAKVRTLGGMDPAAAVNHAALVKLPNVPSAMLSKGSPQPGWTYVGIGPRKAECISLVTGESRVLYEAGRGTEIAVNGIGSGAGFRGVAASGDRFAFAERAGSGQISLVVCGFSGNLAIDRPLSIETEDGESAMGPVLTGDTLALCGARTVAVYDFSTRTPFQMQLPAQFKPLLVRRQGGLNVPVGSVPLTVARGANGLEAWIGGAEDDMPGLLVAEVERKSWRFERTPHAATLSGNPDGTLSLAGGDEVRILGTKSWTSEKLSLEQGMPAVAAGGYLLSFAESGRSGGHNVTLSQPGSGIVGSLAFEDPQCRPQTVCGAAVMDSDIAVAYLPSGGGITVARWNLEQTAVRPA